jgi:hypothetical protein
VGVGPEPDRDTRGDEQLEEIRRLFERYRDAARDARPTSEHDEQAEEALAALSPAAQP